MGLSSVSEATKWQMVAYQRLDYSSYKIADLCGVSRCSVLTTIGNWKETGSVADKPREGRPRCTTPREDRELFRLTRANPTLSVRQLAGQWGPTSDELPSTPQISRQTVVNRLLEFGLESHEQTEKPLLKSQRQKNKICILFEKEELVVSKLGKCHIQR